MKGKYLRKIGGFALTALMLFGIAFVSTSEVQAQSRRGQASKEVTRRDTGKVLTSVVLANI